MQFQNMILLKSLLTLQYNVYYNCLLWEEDGSVRHFQDNLSSTFRSGAPNRMNAEFISTAKTKVDVLLTYPDVFTRLYLNEHYYYYNKVYKLIVITHDFLMFETYEANEYDEPTFLKVDRPHHTETYTFERIIASTIQPNSMYNSYIKDIFRSNNTCVGKELPLPNLADVINHTRDGEYIYKYVDEDLNREVLFTPVFQSMNDLDDPDFRQILACELDAKFDCE